MYLRSRTFFYSKHVHISAGQSCTKNAHVSTLAQSTCMYPQALSCTKYARVSYSCTKHVHVSAGQFCTKDAHVSTLAQSTCIYLTLVQNTCMYPQADLAQSTCMYPRADLAQSTHMYLLLHKVRACMNGHPFAQSTHIYLLLHKITHIFFLR